ncbi:gp53-like domain-containing protein [Xenorhabdus ehlersii]|uniref:Tail protein n=1 Tax=Xenorhabdus ehlersii TaxID=290111 RepID=A0A2D0IRU8_9GAMM|nr:hypothetical protein [Xenorhabdus ehlersii]PHM24571.1 tail protein [Xenorhabdus ehlersii]RKE91210.1 hypothetical protein BDE27_1419 [Xenorhabdus ehlersii]
MANLPETPQWSDGVYQIETSDPVLGGPDGISNRQAKQLASRTSYLKQQLEQNESELKEHTEAKDPHPQYAPKASPVFTGTPTAPTPAQDANNTQIATTAFVQSLANAANNNANTRLEKNKNGADILDKQAFVKNLGLPELIAGNPPAALNTLEKLAQAINNDANFSNSLSEIIKNRQPLNATLTALAGLVTGGDLLPYFTGADTATLSPITPTGRDLISRGSINAVLAYLRFEHGQGWYRLGDIYIQFGLIDFSSSTRVFVEFPFKFPTTVDHVIVSDAGWATGHTWGATNKQRNGFVAHVNVQGEGGQYLAIGR